MIHPRRLKGTARNVARYYTVGDYYTKGGDEPSAWGGKIADDLGLAGAVDPQTFQALLEGKVGDQRLGRHRSDGTIEHHPGWDFAINAPKSVSIMALVASDERIIIAHERAVGVTLSYLEEHAERRRRDSGEIVHETTGRLLFARFTEHASRELDPHLHTHVVVLNLTNESREGPISSLESRALFVEQMTAGQVYRNELAHQLREAGYRVDSNPRTGLFEIRGVPRDLISEMSRRAMQIDAHAEEHGLSGQAARRRSFYETRRAKESRGLEDLREEWQRRSGSHRADLADLRSDANARVREDLSPELALAARAMLFGIRQSDGREAVSNAGQILRAGLASHVGEIRLSDIRPLLVEHQNRAKLLSTRAQTGDVLLIRGRATKRTAMLELSFANHLALAIGDATPVSDARRIRTVLREAGLNPAQETALHAIGTTSDRIVGVHGVAGAGKSTLVRALVQAAEPDIAIVALAPTSSAAANLGQSAGVPSRTVASLLAGGGRDINAGHLLVVDEAGQLGNRQAQRLLEISRITGARLVLLGDNKQTGAIEQGKAFWLLQKLGLPTAQLTESVRQETRGMKSAVARARAGDYAGSLASLDRVVSGEGADQLARGLVAEWSRLKPETRAATNILVLENATRLIVNAQVREALKREGVVAAEDQRLQILSPAGMTEEEKRLARFYSGGQVVRFSRDNVEAGLARDTDYRVVGIHRGKNGRQTVRLIDELGRELRWDPRLGRTTRVNVFVTENRALAVGDRIQWRLANKDLGLNNAERGTVEALAGTRATILWDRGPRRQTVDLAEHRTWDHGYAETVYSAQSRTYARVYVLAPVNSPLVNGQNYYTAITRARLGVKLWTEDPERLVEKLLRRTGEKSSALEGLGRLGAKDGPPARAAGSDLERLRKETTEARLQHRERRGAEQSQSPSPVMRIAESARDIADRLSRWIAPAQPGRDDGRQDPQSPDRGLDR